MKLVFALVALMMVGARVARGDSKYCWKFWPQNQKECDLHRNDCPDMCKDYPASTKEVQSTEAAANENENCDYRTNLGGWNCAAILRDGQCWKYGKPSGEDKDKLACAKTCCEGGEPM